MLYIGFHLFHFSEPILTKVRVVSFLQKSGSRILIVKTELRRRGKLKPGTKGYHISDSHSASLCGKLLRPAIWWCFTYRLRGIPVARCQQNPSYEGSLVRSVVIIF